MRTALVALAAATLCGSATAETTASNAPPPAETTASAVSPPAALAPDDTGGDLSIHLDRLAEARRQVLGARRELREANVALARASRGSSGDARLDRLFARQERAHEAFEAARRRVPEVVAAARAAGLSASAARRYEHSVYGD